MFLHVPNSIILMQNTISHNLMLVETPVRQLTTTELKCLARVDMHKSDLSTGYRLKTVFKTMYKKFHLTFRHRASCILGQAFHYSPENAFYIFNQQIYFII